MSPGKKLGRVNRPPMLDLEEIGSGEIAMEDMSPEARAIMSPLNNRFKYKRRDPTREDVEDEGPRRKDGKVGTAVSLDKRFRWGQGKELESPLLHPVDQDTSQVVNNTSRASFRSSTAGRLPAKTHVSSTKKNTIYETEMSHKGLFVLQKCLNKDEKPSYYD